ncbi:MAG TPA: flagellar biosynthetic protein FliR [Kofleriaceae bacterium]|jgi:flagellar biosynthetic protein FliR
MTLSDPEIGAILAALARATGLVVTAPVVGDQGVPARAKLLFVVAIGIAVGTNRAPVSLADAPLVGALELAAGLLTGFVARVIVSRVAIAGQLAGLSLGLGFASQYDAHAGESAGILRTFASTLASLAFLMCGGLDAIVRSAAAAPASLDQLAHLGPMLLAQGAAAFGHGLALAAPLVLAALAGNLGLAVMNRAAPAVNVFSISLGVVLVIGGLVLLATASELVSGAGAAARDAITVLSGF